MPAGQPPEVQTEQLADPSRLTFQRFRVRVVGGPDAGREVSSEGEELSIGSADGNDLVLSDTTVSRHHCTITASPDGFKLRDLMSTNGTRLGGFKIDGALLRAGATFVAGRTTLSFEPLEEKVETQLSSQMSYAGMVGRSAAMRRVFAMLPRVAMTASTVLIEGETGTGKGVLAASIHNESSRRDGPYVVVDCAAIAPTLIESRLFGHVRGAFTGATEDRPGAFEAASGGTIFLDEVGELPLDVQPKLLRVLEERVVLPLGSVSEVPVDVRVVAATNRDLRAEVNRGTFRADLFYRLHVVRLRMPPLRERREDIPLLIEHFRQQIAPDRPAPPDALVETWGSLHWAGNARELRGAVERHLLLGDDAWETIAQRADPTAALNPALAFRTAKELAIAQFERAYLTMLVQRHGGNLSQAARAARMDRNHLRQLLQRHHIR
jgi:DNA-binding NtrC family response regulator